MPFTSIGYAGDITSVEWARLSQHLGEPARVVSGLTGSAVSGGTRQVSWAAGSAYAGGVLATLTPAQNTTHATVSTGSRWDTVVARFNWSTGTTTLTVVAGGSTEALAGGLNANLGVLYDEPIGLVQITAGQTVPTAVRNLAPPKRHDSRLYTYALSGTEIDNANQPAGEEWPQVASVNIHIPRWAGRIDVATTWAGVRNPGTANTNGAVWNRLDTIDLNATRYWPIVAGSDAHTMTLHAAAGLVLPASLKGRTVRLAPCASGPATGPALGLDNVSSVSMHVDFKE